jgi:hypothetical protein
MGNKRGKKALDLPLFPALYPLFPMEASGRPWTISDGSRSFYLVKVVFPGLPEIAVDAILVCPEGLEPPTPSLEGWCSIQLSYGQLGRPKRVSALVGAAGFELATYWSQTSCATRLRYAPTKTIVRRGSRGDSLRGECAAPFAHHRERGITTGWIPHSDRRRDDGRRRTPPSPRRGRCESSRARAGLSRVRSSKAGSRSGPALRPACRG